MKKLIVLMLMILAASIAFAVAGETVESTSTEVSLAIDDSGSGAEMIELVLTKDEITDEDLGATSTKPNAATTLSLEFGDVSSVAEGSINAWWRVLSGLSLDIEVGVDKALSNGTSQIEWSASWKSGEAPKTVKGAKDQTEAKYETVGSHTPSTSSVMTVGSAPISLKTDQDTDFTKIGTGTYKANLILRCVTK